MQDLWPKDIAPAAPPIKPPVTLLREQAALLGTKTKNIVEAEVIPLNPLNKTFGFGFQLVGPALNNYRFPLFNVEYPIEMYPVRMDVSGEVWGKDPESTTPIELHSEQEFLAALAKVFSAEKTRRVIQAIQAQSTAAA